MGDLSHASLFWTRKSRRKLFGLNISLVMCRSDIALGTKMLKILTKRKQAWADRRKPEVVKGTALQYNAAIETRYYLELDRLIQQMVGETKHKIVKVMIAPDSKEYFAMDDSIASSSRITTNALRRKFTQLFREKAKGMAERMISATDAATSAALHQSLKQLSGGLSLGTRVLNEQTEEIMKASIAESVSLIKSIPEKYFTNIEGAVMRSITTGKGLQDLVPFFKKQKGITQRRARLIAGDQSRKAYTNISAARMKEIGVRKYIWRHSSAAEEARPLHLKLNNTTQSLDDPPIIQYAKGKQREVRGKPGDLINCLCVMIPIVDFSGKD